MTSMTDTAEVTETNPNRRSRRDGPAGSSRGERPLRSALRRLEETLEHAGPIRVSDRTRVALQTGLAMALAYGVALAMDWHKPYWAGLAVAFCGLGSIGESLHKGLQRVLGTLVALVLAFVVLSLFIQDRWLFLLALSLWTAFCNYVSMTSARSYFWYVAGFSLPLLTVAGGGVPVQTFDVVVLRAQQTLLGVLSFTLVAVLLLPVSSGHGLAARAAELVSALRGLARDAFSKLTVITTPNAKIADPDPEQAELEEVRTQATRALGALPQLLAAAELDTYAVWESRHAWRAALRDLGELNRTLERLRQNHGELADVDLPNHLQGLETLRAAVDSRLQRVEALLPAVGDTERDTLPPGAGDAAADPINLDLDIQESGLSAFERAALALTRRQLIEVERLTADLNARVEAIALLTQVPPDTNREGDEALPASPFSLPVLLEPERLRGLVRQQSTFWLAVLCLFYIPDVPLSDTTIVIAASLSMSLNLMPQVRPQILITPVVVGVLFAGVMHLIVMPHLEGFAALGALLFAVTFLISWLFHEPGQVIAKSIGLASFVMIMAVDNQQAYSFEAVANLAIGLPMVVLIMVFTTYFPLSFRAEDRFAALIARWFRSASWLLGTLGTDAERAQQAGTTGFRVRLAYHRQAIEHIPQLLTAWTRALSPAAFGSAGPVPMQTLVTALRAMSIRIEDLLEARDAVHSPAMERALAAAVREWRLVVRELLATAATDPAHMDATDLRARLDGKLQQIERLMERAMNEDPDFHAHLSLNENSYRLLGAYRGLSESLVNFARAAHSVDWPCLREPRF